MPKEPPFQQQVTPALRTSLHPPGRQPIDDSAASESLSSPVHLSSSSSRHASRTPSPFVDIPRPGHGGSSSAAEPANRKGEESDSDLGFDDWNDDSDDDDMPSDLRPPFSRPSDGRSHTPLLAHKDEDPEDYGSPPRPVVSRRSTFHERDPELEAKHATRKKYTYAGGFLLLSLISFAVQTETAVYIQHTLHWNKAYCML